jgi:hypothetical protein
MFSAIFRCVNKLCFLLHVATVHVIEKCLLTVCCAYYRCNLRWHTFWSTKLLFVLCKSNLFGLFQITSERTKRILDFSTLPSPNRTHSCLKSKPFNYYTERDLNRALYFYTEKSSYTKVQSKIDAACLMTHRNSNLGLPVFCVGFTMC